MYVCMYVHTFVQKDVHSYPHSHIRKTEKLYVPGIIRCGGRGGGVGGEGGGHKKKM